MTKILLIGKRGQIGWELHRVLPLLGEVTALGREMLDLADENAIRIQLRDLKPDIVVNAAAYTAVDKAESEADLAHLINAIAPRVLAEESLRLGASLIHYSTDYVFDGMKEEPYSERDGPNPINVYGSSKLKGEQAVIEIGGHYLIFRTSWVYSMRRPSFPIKVLSWSRSQESMRVVEDQTGSPTWCRIAAAASACVLASFLPSSSWPSEKSGLYHLACVGSVNRLEWARRILALDPSREQQVVREILPARSDEFDTPAKRPRLSSLDVTHFQGAFGLRLPHWEVCLRRAMEDTGATRVNP